MPAPKTQILTFLVSLFVTLTQARATQQEGTSIEELLLSDWPVGKPLGHFFNSWLIAGARTTVGDATPEQVDLGCLWKQAELDLRSRLVSSVPPWPLYQFLVSFFSSCPDFLYDGQINPFLSKSLVLMVFYHSNRSLRHSPQDFTYLFFMW